MNIYDDLKNYGVLPVIKIEDENKAVALAEALIQGGLNAAEITFRTKCAPVAIKKIAEAFPDMLVAAGTVLTIEQAKQAVDSGAKIIIAPGLNEKTAKYCVDNNIVMIPGCATPSDIERALDLGINTVKFFPAEDAGGISMIKALSAPYSQVKFVPTGGINENNFLDYLNIKSVLAVGGSFMVREDYIKNGEFDKIKELTSAAVKKLLGFRNSGMIITAENAERADANAKRIADIFGFAGSSDENFATADTLRFAKSKSYGRDGSFIIETNFLERAVFYLKRRGVEFIDESARYDSNGALSLLYLDCMIGGFGVRLEQK